MRTEGIHFQFQSTQDRLRFLTQLPLTRLYISGSDNPVLFCTGLKQARFFLFSNREPSDTPEQPRDIFTERPKIDHRKAVAPASSQLPGGVIVHTTMGDIHIKLFGAQCPK